MADKEHIHRAVHVNQKLASGLAQGFSAGYARFLDHIAATPAKDFDNKRGGDHPLLHGALLGWMEFLDKVGQSYLDVADLFQTTTDRSNVRKKE